MITRFAILPFLLSAALAAETLDLAGEWKLALDPGDTGLAAGPGGWRFDDTIRLPNTLTLRIDNREKLPIGIGHAYTNATQTIWNGAIGRLSLTALPKARVETLRLRPAGNRVATTVRSGTSARWKGVDS